MKKEDISCLGILSSVPQYCSNDGRLQRMFNVTKGQKKNKIDDLFEDF